MESHRVIIAGSRSISLSPPAMSDIIRTAGYEVSPTLAKIDGTVLVEHVVCGKAKGIDTSGEEWAHTCGIEVKEYPANWKAHGRKAGPIRNKEMALNADTLLLIWDGKSSGSGSMKSIALAMGVPVYEVVMKGWL